MEACDTREYLQHEKWSDRRCHNIIEQNLDEWPQKMPADAQIDELYAWHGHITKLNGKNTIFLMNDRTMYSLIFRNRLPRNVDKFAELIKEAIPYTMEVGGFNNPEIDKYMSGRLQDQSTSSVQNREMEDGG